MSQKYLYIICFVRISIGVICEETIKGNESLFNCVNETDCETFGSTETAETEFEMLNEDKLSIINVTPVSSITSTKPSSSGTRPQTISNVVAKFRNDGEVCSCDLTV